MKISGNCRSGAIAGLSLIDLLLVIALTMVVGAMSVPAMTSAIRDYRLAVAADGLAAELNAARVSAVSRGTNYRLDLNTTDRTFQIVDVAAVNNPTRVARTLENGVNFGAVTSSAILFTSRGTARGGTIELLTGQGRGIEILVSPSGQTRVGKVESVEE